MKIIFYYQGDMSEEKYHSVSKRIKFFRISEGLWG
jgi:hypothetical protein